MPPGGQIGLNPLLQCRQPLLLQACDLYLGKRLVR